MRRPRGRCPGSGSPQLRTRLPASRDPVVAARGRSGACGGCPTRTRPRASSSTSSATRRWPISSARSVPACDRWNTSSATPPSAPHTIRARPPASSPPESPPSYSASPWRISASRRFGRRTRRSRSPPWPGAAGAPCSTPNESLRCTTGTWPEARCSRTSANGSARATTRSRVKTWRPRSCANAPPFVAGSASSTDPPSARSTSRVPMRANSSTCSTRT